MAFASVSITAQGSQTFLGESSVMSGGVSVSWFDSWWATSALVDWESRGVAVASVGCAHTSTELDSPMKVFESKFPTN